MVTLLINIYILEDLYITQIKQIGRKYRIYTKQRIVLSYSTALVWNEPYPGQETLTLVIVKTQYLADGVLVNKCVMSSH